jgi:hypothetical protein
VPDIKDALLVSYVVYDHPSDFPNLFVVRRVLVYRDTVEPVYDPSYFIYSEDVEDCRKAMVNLGLYRMPPEPGDDPVILEVWL